MIKWLKKYIDPIVPLYTIIPLICSFAFNSIIYSGTIFLTRNRKHYDFTGVLEEMFPLLPSFTFIYLGCFAFWIVNYVIIARLGKTHFFKFQVADLSSRVICGIFFLLIPTTNVRPDIVGNTVGEWLLRFVYFVDEPANLFPSIHCLVSWFCYIGIRGEKRVPKLYQWFSCIFAILVFISTLATKQHYFIDVIAGVLIAEITYYISKKIDLYKKLDYFFERINNRLHLCE